MPKIFFLFGLSPEVQVSLCLLFTFQKMLKGKKEVHEGYIMFVRRNALQVYVPRYAMEGFIFFPKDATYEYNEKVWNI